MKIQSRKSLDTSERDIRIGYTSVVVNPDTFEPMLFAKVFIPLTKEEKDFLTLGGMQELAMTLRQKLVLKS